MKRKYPKIIRNRKQRIERRLDHKRHWSEQPEPMMSGGNIHYDMAERIRAINCGGIGAMHLIVKKLGLIAEIDKRVHVLKRHLPYHEHIDYGTISTTGQTLYRRAAGAARTGVPKTAIDEEREFLAFEVKIRSAWYLLRMLSPAGYFGRAECCFDNCFSRTISGRSHFCHPGGTLADRERIGCCQESSHTTRSIPNLLAALSTMLRTAV